MDQLVNPKYGYRLRAEIFFDENGEEAPRSGHLTKGPDIILERQVERAGVMEWEVVHAWDYKTGGAHIKPDWEKEVRRRLDLPSPVEELKPTGHY